MNNGREHSELNGLSSWGILRSLDKTRRHLYDVQRKHDVVGKKIGVYKLDDKIHYNKKLQQIINTVGCIFLTCIPIVGIFLAAAADAVFKAYCTRRDIHDAEKQRLIFEKQKAAMQAKYDALPDAQKQIINDAVAKYGDAALDRPEIKAILDGVLASGAASLDASILAAGGNVQNADGSVSQPGQFTQAQLIAAQQQMYNQSGAYLQNGGTASGEINKQYLLYGGIAVGGLTILYLLTRSNKYAV